MKSKTEKIRNVTVGLLPSAVSLFSDVYEIPILVVIVYVSLSVSTCCHFVSNVKTRCLEISRGFVSHTGETPSCHSSRSHKLFLLLSISTNPFALTAQQWLQWKTLDSSVCSHYPCAQVPLNF